MNRGQCLANPGKEITGNGLNMLTAQDMQICEARVEGATLQKIANQNGFDVSTASRKLSKPELQAYLDKLQIELINNTLPIAAENIHHAIGKYKSGATIKALTKDGQEIELPDSQLRDHGFKASLRVLESTGLLNSHAPSVIFQQIINDNSQHIHLEEASKTALEHLGVIDVTDGQNTSD
jgi:hypothetical protein